jgi:hypothetical protein
MFASFRKVVAEEERKTLLDECVQLFTAKDRRKGSGYSEGQTFWVSATEEKPKLAIEAFALDVFDRHARGISFDRANSGVEFWPLVIESDDDVGAHFDKVGAFQLNLLFLFCFGFVCLFFLKFKIFQDYSAEDDGFDLYPYIGTVTYLSGDNSAAPTMFFECCENEFPKQSISRVYLSFVEEGKHVKFDGRMLHLASGEMRAAGAWQKNQRRVTLLINVWLDHRPKDAVRYDDTTEKCVVWKDVDWPKEDVLPIVETGESDRILKMALDKKRQIRFCVPVTDVSCVIHFAELCCSFEAKKKKKKEKKEKKRKDKKKK